MLQHEFAILDDPDPNHEYDYDDLKKLNYIVVHDALVQSIVRDLSIMKTYYNNMNRPELGLDYWGITLIPPTSLPHFQSVLHSIRKRSFPSSDLLAQLIFEAMEQNKHVIHFGI